MKRRHDSPILAIDPGLRELGYAILRDSNLLDHGVLSLTEVQPRRRLGRVREFLEAKLRGYRPRTLVLEHIPNRALDHLGGLPALGRLLRRMAKQKRLTVATYSARAARRSVTSDGWAGKAEAADILVRRFPTLRVYRSQDRKWKTSHWLNMFDALGLAIHHLLQSKPPSRSR